MTLKSNCRWCSHLVTISPPRAKWVGGCEFRNDSEPCDGASRFELADCYEGNDPRPVQQFEEWHCESEIDRKLADTLVDVIGVQTWDKIAEHFGTGYPYHTEDKYHLVYRLMGCKN